MTVDETRALIEMLRSQGITHYKTGEIELALTPLPEAPKASPVESPAMPGVDSQDKIPHVVQELTSLLKLSDADLVDRMFPDHTVDASDEELMLYGEAV